MTFEPRMAPLLTRTPRQSYQRDIKARSCSFRSFSFHVPMRESIPIQTLLHQQGRRHLRTERWFLNPPCRKCCIINCCRVLDILLMWNCWSQLLKGPEPLFYTTSLQASKLWQVRCSRSRSRQAYLFRGLKLFRSSNYDTKRTKNHAKSEPYVRALWDLPLQAKEMMLWYIRRQENRPFSCG